MKIMTRAGVCAVSICLLLACTAWAGPFRANDVAADAKWVAHIDVQELVSSQIGKFFLEQMDKEGDLAKIEAFGTIVEFNPMEDLYSVTAYGTDFEEEEGVAILKGRFDAEKIEALMTTEGSLEKRSHEGCKLLKWFDGDETFYVCFFKPEVIIFSNSVKLVENAVSVMNGDLDRLRDGGALDGMYSLPDGTFLSASAYEFENLIPDDESHADLLKKAKKVFVLVGECEGSNFVKVILQVQDRETAEMIYDIGKGLKAVGSLIGGIEEPELAELIKAVDLNLNGKKIILQISKPTTELSNLLKEQMD